MKKLFLAAIVTLILPLSASAQQPLTSTDDQQTSIEVTVYNSNLGLVKDTRSIDLPTGKGELRFMDVASSIIPETVHVKSLSDAEKFMVLEQNYEYDLISPSKLLDKYVGKRIKIYDQNEFQDRTDIKEAVLLSNNNNQPIYEIDGEIFLGHPGLNVLPSIPDNLIAKPTLTWMFQNETESAQKIEVSYLTNNISWKADYVLVLDQKDVNADLAGWVTVNNSSGASYQGATLKLVAGEVNRATGRNMLEGRDFMAKGMRMEAAAPQFAEKAFFEYHIYDLQRPTTVKNNQTKQISLLEAAGISVEKEFRVYGIQGTHTYHYRVENNKLPVHVNIAFENKEDNKLGMPLPAGIIRLYKADSDDQLQFIGEDNIEHTPRNEKVTVKVGEAFDVVAERKQLDFQQITSRMYESEWEVSLRNRKEETINVQVIEPLPFGTWQVMSNSHSYEKKDAFTLQFNVPVAADSEVKVRYRIRVGI
jgi:hypothetical protein